MANCPECGGPVEVVRRWSDGTVAYRCVNGHSRRSHSGEVITVHPVYITSRR